MSIHINANGQISNNSSSVKQQTENTSEEKVYSIFDVDQDGKVDTSEQMKQVRKQASSFGDYVNVWASEIARFFQNVISYVTNSSAVTTVNRIVNERIERAIKYLRNCVNNGDESPFIKESDKLITNDDGSKSEDPNSYTSTGNANGEQICEWNNGETYTYSKENDCLVTKIQTEDGTYTYSYNENGSYTRTDEDGTIFEYDVNGERVSMTYTNGTKYTFKNNADKSHSSYIGNSWKDSWHADNSQMGMQTKKGNYKFYPATSISVEDAANKLGVDVESLRKANPKAAKTGFFAPPNDIYVPKSLLSEDFDPSTIIV